MSGSLVEAVHQMLAAGLTQEEVAEVLSRTCPGREDEQVVINEVMRRRERPEFRDYGYGYGTT